jgi:NAD(P)-dependent dehydrogenase (short-subunit alcohol dehydrogenase family)
MPTVLVTGANRGLGLEFVRQYAQAGWTVLAACRRPSEAAELSALAEQYDKLKLYPLELADFASIDRLATELAEVPIDVLLSNAGVYGDDGRNGFGAMDYARWLDSFVINTQAPLKLAEAFLPQVKRSERRLIVAITSLMGSIADNTSGGSIMYRSSKAALNAAMKSLALDLAGSGVGVLILHPGWVQTDMGGERAPTKPEESIAEMRNVIDGFTLSATGRFTNFRGNELAW